MREAQTGMRGAGRERRMKEAREQRSRRSTNEEKKREPVILRIGLKLAGAVGHMDCTGQRKPIHAVVQTYSRFWFALLAPRYHFVHMLFTFVASIVQDLGVPGVDKFDFLPFLHKPQNPTARAGNVFLPLPLMLLGSTSFSKPSPLLTHALLPFAHSKP